MESWQGPAWLGAIVRSGIMMAAPNRAAIGMGGLHLRAVADARRRSNAGFVAVSFANERDRVWRGSRGPAERDAWRQNVRPHRPARTPSYVPAVLGPPPEGVAVPGPS